VKITVFWDVTRAVWWMFTDVSEERTVSIFIQNGGKTFFGRNDGKQPPHCTRYIPEGSNTEHLELKMMDLGIQNNLPGVIRLPGIRDL
jgi:hypothetical protein